MSNALLYDKHKWIPVQCKWWHSYPIWRMLNWQWIIWNKATMYMTFLPFWIIINHWAHNRPWKGLTFTPWIQMSLSAPFYGIELSNLRELCIQTGFPLTTRHVNDLKRVAETCPNVTSLSLQAEDKIIDRVMGCLQHFQNLKELHVTAEKISQKGAMKCMYCRHLKELELSCLNDLRNVFTVLRMQVPKVYWSVYWADLLITI